MEFKADQKLINPNEQGAPQDKVDQQQHQSLEQQQLHSPQQHEQHQPHHYPSQPEQQQLLDEPPSTPAEEFIPLESSAELLHVNEDQLADLCKEGEQMMEGVVVSGDCDYDTEFKGQKGTYETVMQIGAGSSGDVYMVKLESIVAVAKKFKNPSDSQRELQFLMDLKYNKYLLPLVDYGVNFIIMKMAYKDLRLLRKEQPNQLFTPSTIGRIGKQALKALEFIHGRGIIHRDIKDPNFVTGHPQQNQQQRIFLIDFGLATHIDDAGKGVFFGSPRYASCNALRFNPQSATDDLHSFLQMLIQCSQNLNWSAELNEDGEVDYEMLADAKERYFKNVHGNVQIKQLGYIYETILMNEESKYDEIQNHLDQIIQENFSRFIDWDKDHPYDC